MDLTFGASVYAPALVRSIAGKLYLVYIREALKLAPDSTDLPASLITS